MGKIRPWQIGQCGIQLFHTHVLNARMMVSPLATVEHTRERLLAAAGAVFAEKGFQDATVREICQAAEVNLAAINYHFRDKERLYIESVKRAHCLRAEEVPLPAWPTGTPAGVKLHGFVSTMLQRMLGSDSPSWHQQLMMRELLKPTAACAELVRDFFRPHFEQLQKILDELLPIDVPLARRQMIGFSVIGQCLHYRVAKPIVELLVGPVEQSRFTLEALAEHITQFTLAALGSKAASAKLQTAVGAIPVEAKP